MGAGVKDDVGSDPQRPSSGSGGGYGGLGPSGYTAGVAVLVSLLLIVALVRLLRYALRRSAKPPVQVQQHPPAAAAAAGDPSVTREVAVEMAAAPATAAGACVATYRRSDGWREASCPVCLCDFADGEALRVLPACMHYFHAACVGEWLHRNDTCPLCRAAPPPPEPPQMPSPAVAPTA